MSFEMWLNFGKTTPTSFPMKHLFSALLAVAMIPLTYWAQTPPLASSSFSTEAPTGYWLEIETVTSHTGWDIGWNDHVSFVLEYVQ